MQGFDTVRHELDAKRQQLEEELQAAQGKVAELQADLERVHEALEALIRTKRRTKSGGRSRAGKKPGASVQELQRHIARVREEKPFASAPELQKAVRALVRASGVSLSGFPRQFAEALVSSPGFSGSVDPASLVSAAKPAIQLRSESASHEAPHSSEGEEEEASKEEPETHEEEDVQAASSDEGPFTNLL